MKLTQLLTTVLALLLCANAACANPFLMSDAEAAETLGAISQQAKNFRIETVAANLEVPWSIQFAPDGRMFFTERPGRLRVIENGKLRAQALATIADVEASGESGLMGMVLHPDFAENHWLYLAYAYDDQNDKMVRVARYRETGDGLTDAKMIIEKLPAAQFHAGTRLRFGPDKKLYVTTGDATNQSQAQQLNQMGGKTLRLNDDGSIPTDNPFVNDPKARPEIWSYGHRNAQGMDFHPETGAMFQTEHGPSLIDGVSLFKRSGGDEVNLVERGKNYGWAKISHEMRRDKMETALIQFSPAIAPASGMFYRGSLFPDFKNSFLFGALRAQTIVRIVFDNAKVVKQERLLDKSYGRIREVAEAPDGSIYFSTSNRDGRGEPTAEDDRILRIVPLKN